MMGSGVHCGINNMDPLYGFRVGTKIPHQKLSFLNLFFHVFWCGIISHGLDLIL